jgi:hypothetical protein
MNLHKDKNGEHFIKLDLYQEFIDELFVAKVRLTIKDLQDYQLNGSSHHPEDNKVWEEQLIAHHKILEWYTPESEWEDLEREDPHQEEEEGNW